MIKCLVIDDEPLAQEIIKSYILKTNELYLTGSCYTAAEGFACLSKHQVDLVFLDIKMPTINGIQFISSLTPRPAFVFTTAYSEYAQLSYELDAVDYLLKPITYERFLKAVTKYKTPFIQQEQIVKNYLYIKADGRLIKLIHDEIIFAKSYKDYIKITTTSKQYLIHQTMKSFYELLPASIFKRIHRSYIVNKDYIKAIEKNNIIVQDISIPIGENYRTDFTQ